MNKKFSTLVAALLVSGVSYAVVSQMDAATVANPVQTTAAVNLRASEATEATAETSFAKGDVKWTYTSEGYLQWGNFYLASADGKLSKNIADAKAVTYTAGVLQIGGADITIDGNSSLSAFTANKAYVAGALSTGTEYYIAGKNVETPDFTTADKAITAVVPTLTATLSVEDNGSTGTQFDALKSFSIKLKTGTTDVYVLALGDYYFKAGDANSDVELTADENEAAVLTLDGVNGNVVKLGENYLCINTTVKLEASETNAVKAWTDKDTQYADLAASTVYLSKNNTGDDADVAISADQQAPTVAKITIDAAGILANTLKLTATAKSVGGLNGFTLKNSTNYLVAAGTNVSVGVEGSALIFTTDADGLLKNGAKYLVIDNGALQLADAVTGTAKAVKAYDVNGEAVSTLVTTTDYIIGEAIPSIVRSLNLASDNILLAGITSSANLINGENYFITATNGALCALAMNANGIYDRTAPTSGESVSLRADNGPVAEALWTVEKTQPAGQEATYKFKNNATGKYLAFDIVESTVALKPNGKYNVFKLEGEAMRVTVTETGANAVLNGNYYVDHNISGEWNVSQTASALTFKAPKEVPADKPAIDAQIKYLNETAGTGAGFGVLFKETGKDGKLKNMTVAANPFTDASLITAVKGPESFVGLYTVGDMVLNTANLSGKMFFRVDGNYSSDMKHGSADEKKAMIAAFRSSQFIVVDTVRYSKHISDVDDNNNYFLKYKTVAGSELMSAVGFVFAGTYDENDFKAYHATKNPTGGKLVGVTRRIENATFTVDQLAGDKITDPAYIYSNAVIPAADNKIGLAGHVVEAGKASLAKLYIGVKEYDKVNYVGAVEQAQRWDKVYLGLNNDVDYTFVNGIVNIISRNYKTDGQVYANLENKANGSIGRVLAKYVSLDKPEGQFLVTGGDYAANGSINPFVFTNRESGESDFVGGSSFSLKKTDKENIYWMVGTTDTVEIKSASTANQYVGYKNYTQNELKNTTYVLKISSKAGGVNDLYITEDHNKDHSLGLHADTLEAANFKLVKFEAAKSDKKLYGDTVYVSQVEAPYSYLKGDDKEYAEDKNDRVVAFTYAIYNADNKEFLTVKDMGTTLENYYYCNPDLKYAGDNADKNAAVAQRFIVKEKADGTYQLIPVKHIVAEKNIFESATDVEAPVLFTETANSKLYVGLSDNKVHYEAPIYKIADNDLFRIVPVGAPMYRTVDAAPFDTIRVYKEGMDNVALFAETADKQIVSGGHFLGMKHKADKDLTKTMFSFFVDTAYVNREDNYKPQYMLVLDADTLHGFTQCPIPSHGIEDNGRIDTVTGKFLTTMVDSIPAWGKNHSNPYWWEKEEYPRLGFVNAKHIGDDLIVLRDNGIQTKADTIKLDNNNDKAGVFAFRYVDQATKSFLMETKGGWVKWLNGVPVVVSKIEEAEVFNFEATTNTPTNNDKVTASEVSVIASTASVIVKGAAGKTVTVSNILGQTIVNTVLTSDNATIAVPAGIVVVAVEGEEAVKTVVR